VQNDVVAYAGASWLARRANKAKQPGIAATAADWQLLAARGAIGLQGVAGPAGSRGPIGPQGPVGPAGPMGAIGETGPQGVAGPPGVPGPAGPAGVMPQGEWQGTRRYEVNDLVLYEGSTWRALIPNELVPPHQSAGEWQLFAERGMDGAAGGPPGPAGPIGPQGPSGVDGAQGPAGPQGPQGDPGPAGQQGPAGADGTQGPAGPQGPQGDPGPAGPEGAAGESATIVKKSKECASPGDYSFDQANAAYCVIACDEDEIGLFTWWEWVDLSNGERIAAYSSTIQMYTSSVPELDDRYGFAAYIGSNGYMTTRKMTLLLFCTRR
jgi:hypothetical protein